MNNEKTIEVLGEVVEYLQGKADVADGAHGDQVPNAAMKLLLKVEQEIERLKRGEQ